jgi:large subunit ribosomal protein L9
MKVILRENVERLGRRGEIVEVKPGYARNFLIPRGLALFTTPGSLRQYEEEQRMEGVREGKRKRQAEEDARRLQRLSLTAMVKASEDGKLFGSVTGQDVADLIAREGLQVDRKQILLEEPIKALGVYTVPVRLHAEVQTEVKLWVVHE